jgi:hypothetical protein
MRRRRCRKAAMAGESTCIDQPNIKALAEIRRSFNGCRNPASGKPGKKSAMGPLSAIRP